MSVPQCQCNVCPPPCPQVVVAPHSYIIGRSIKDLKFRTKYDAAIVAVQRQVRQGWAQGPVHAHSSFTRM